MPFSAEFGKADIRKTVSRVRHAKMLDIGCGCGTYAKMFPDAEWTGVEVWAPYVEKYDLKSLYGTLHVEDARAWEPTERYDVAFAGDVLEHMTAEEAAALLLKLRACADTVIVSLPLGHHPQDEYEGNPHERHVVDDWTHEKAVATFGAPDHCHLDHFIGVYVWSDQHLEPIPNIVHMIWFTGENSRPFSFINYLAVRAAKEVQNPNNIYVYYNEDLPDNPHWQAAKKYATFVKVDEPTEYWGIPLRFPQYKSDIFRLQKLHEVGGIYLDTDAILTKPLTELLGNNCVLNIDHKHEVIANGIMLSQPKNPFIGRWLEEIAFELNNPVWASHSVVLPYRIYKSGVWQMPELPTEAFLPFGWEDKFVLGNDGSNLSRLANAYCLHMWESMWPEVAQIDNDYLLNSDSLFAQTFRKYAKRSLKIAVYAISKNEEMFVERFCNSAKEADYVVIADTGSTDGTVAAGRRCDAIVHSIHISPWRFDTARNAALALVPGDVDVCISLDLDEVLEPGWREEIERVWAADTTRLRYYFDWGCGIKFKYEKIHHRKGYLWHHPCHEYPVPDPRTQEVWADTDMLLVSHHPDPTKSRGQYLDLLAISVKEDPHCPRNAFYYARELSFYSKWDEAIVALNKYLGMPEATWGNERCYAYRVLGKCYEEKGRPWEAEAAYYKACAEAPNTREPWCALAMLAYRQGRWAESYGAAMRALTIKDRALVYTCDPEVWGAQPHDLASIAAWHLGLYKIAVEQAALAVEKSPDDLRLRANLKAVTETLKTAA